MKLCSKCGHPVADHNLEVEALSLNVEKHNETTSAVECRAKENGTFCGCRYVSSYELRGKRASLL